jgi:hypothetical protein
VARVERTSELVDVLVYVLWIAVLVVILEHI